MPLKASGYQTKSASQILESVQAAYINTFGVNFNLAPASINGQFIQFDTNMAIEVENAKALLFGSLYNPNQTNSVWLDSICKFNSIDRKEATSSEVICVITGAPNTVINELNIVLNNNGDEFYNPVPIVIPQSGSISATFLSVVKGEIPCDAGTITRIVQSTPGWDTINNPTDGIVGTNEETDQQLRYRRQYSLAVNSAGGLNSIISALNNLSGLINFTVQENPTGSSKSIFGVDVNPYTVYVSTYGPDSLNNDIAKILYTKRYCGMQGNFTYTYQDLEYNWVTFDAQWQKATPVDLLVDIEMPKDDSYPPNIVDLIKQSLVDNFEGKQPPIPAYRMTQIISGSRFYYSLNLVGVIVVFSITVGIDPQDMMDTVTIPMDKVFILNKDNISVNII